MFDLVVICLVLSLFKWNLDLCLGLRIVFSCSVLGLLVVLLVCLILVSDWFVRLWYFNRLWSCGVDLLLGVN